MRILALETVETSGTVAALADQTLLSERQLDGRRRSAQSLAPAIVALLAETGWRAEEVELVAVATGPGSFTGLRIGVTTAKAFAYAAGCQVLGVHTLSAIAARVPSELERFAVVLDAQRDELYAADFTRTSAATLEGQATTRLVTAERWLAELAAGAVVTGPGLTRIVDRLPAGVTAIDPSRWSPTATAVGQMAHAQYVSGQRDSVFDLVPHYIRKSAAEEKLT